MLDRLRILLERALAPMPAGIFSDYLTPAELATEFGICEDQLFEWKCNGLGPPRTRIRPLVIYRRKRGSPRGTGQMSQLLPCGRSFSCLTKRGLMGIDRESGE
jgi:hypothetical protein